MEAKRGKVITFYSYKGGTGRSMALANVACLLARRSDVKRVLAIDWDLDAPGLHHYFWPTHLRDSDGHPSVGVLELFANIQELIQRKAGGKAISEEDSEDVLATVGWETLARRTGQKNVDLLTAGRIDATYAERVAHFDWRALFDAAPTLMRVFAEHLALRYDYVLVDSRTGLNDISGICTTLLPDELVFVFTPNQQSIDGGIEVLSKATAYRRESEDLRPLIIFPLQSRLEMSEPQLMASWRFGADAPGSPREGYQPRFERLFRDVYGLGECDLQSYFNEVQIQHVPQYSYGETLAVISEQGQGSRLSLSRSYAAFADVLAKYDSPWAVTVSTQGGAELVASVSPTSVKVNAAKEFVSDERSRIKLHDLVAAEIRQVLPQIQGITYQGHWSLEQFQERLRSYEAICHDLLHLEVVLAFWGGLQHESDLVLGPKRIVAHVRPESGLTVWLAMRWYPAMLLTYAAGLAAVAAKNYKVLHALFSVRVSDGYRTEDLVRAVGRAAGELNDGFKQLPEYSRRHTPRSDYLHGLLQPILDSVVFVGSEYDEVFDRFELLLALDYAYRSSQDQSGRAWGPPGRFAWKHDESPLSLVVAEAEAAGDDWEPLKAGFFGGSMETFRNVSAQFRELIGRFGFY